MKNIENSTPSILDYIDVFLDPVIVIITFFLGFLLANIQAKRKDKKENSDLFEYFSVYLTKQNESIKKQLDNMKEHLVILESLSPFNGPKVIFIIQPYHLLESMNKERLVQSFKQKEISQNVVLNIISFIDLTKISFNHYQEFHAQYLKDQSLVREKWNFKMTELHQLKMDLMVSASEETLSEKPELVKLNDCYNLLTEDMGVSEVLETFIKPMIDYFNDLYGKDHKNETVNLLLAHFQKIEIIYMESMAFIKRYKTFLSNIIEVLESEEAKSEILKYAS